MNIKIDALSEKIKGQHSRYQTIVMVFALILLCGLFSIPGLPGGDDWLFFHYTVQRIVSAEPLYLINAENTNPSNTANFYPPWVSLTLLIPGLLPPLINKYWKRYHFDGKFSYHSFNSAANTILV